MWSSPRAATPTLEGRASGAQEAPATPVTIEAPDGSLHSMDVELEGITSTAELRRGMLQGYREMLGVQLPPHALRVHAKLASGAKVLLTDETPLSATLLSATSFYVWAVLDAQDVRGLGSFHELHAQRAARGIVDEHHYASTTPWPPPPEPIVGAETPSVSQLKAALGVGSTPSRPH